MRARLAGALGLAGSLLACAAPTATATAAVGSAVPRAQVQGAARLPRDASLDGALTPGIRLSLTVGLSPRRPAALARYAATVSSPGSPVYHRYLSTSQFARRFGAGRTETSAVRAALIRAGLTVGELSPGGLSLPVAGDVRRVERAFHTALRGVTLRGGRRAYADVVAPSLPTGVAADVQGVLGLETTTRLQAQGLERARRVRVVAGAHAAIGAAGPQTCAAAAADGLEYGANTAREIGQAYGLDGLWDEGDLGAGTTVAVYELEPFSASDIATYESCAGISPTVNVTTVDGGAGSGAGSGEAALDIEDIAGLAPAATIDVYEGPDSSSGPYDTYERIIDDDTAKVISTSWGTCEANMSSGELTMENTLFQEAATHGQTVLAAAGDDGADDCGTKGPHAGTLAVDDPAAQPYVTGVGGTSMAPGSAPADESVWNDSEGAGGGGVSHVWEQPSWQGAAVSQTGVSCHEKLVTVGSGVQSTPATTACREVPDVSADADPATGYVIDWNGGWLAVGGTSAAAPTWAALVALADASSYCAGGSPGFLNPALYSLPETDFDDVTSGANTFGGVSGYPAGVGYDMASGLGAPNGSQLVPALCGASAGTTVSEPAAGSSSPAPPAPTSTTPTTTPTTTTSPTSAPPAAPTTTTGATTITTTATTTTTTTAPPPPGFGRRPASVTVTLDVPAQVRDTVGRPVRVHLRAGDRGGSALSFSALRLPPGLRISRATGLVSGRPRRAGTWVVSVSAADRAGDARTDVIRWTVRGA